MKKTLFDIHIKFHYYNNIYVYITIINRYMTIWKQICQNILTLKKNL